MREQTFSEIAVINKTQQLEVWCQVLT